MGQVRDSMTKQLAAGIDYFGSTEMADLLSESAQEIEQLQAENEGLKKVLHYLSGLQDIVDAKYFYPVEHHEWAVGQENGSITGDFDKWIIKQALKGGE